MFTVVVSLEQGYLSKRIVSMDKSPASGYWSLVCGRLVVALLECTSGFLNLRDNRRAKIGQALREPMLYSRARCRW